MVLSDDCADLIASTAVPATASGIAPAASSRPSAMYTPAVATPPAALASTWVTACCRAARSWAARS